jgi:hypothetical protein
MVFLCVLLVVYGLAMVFAPQFMNSLLVVPLLYHTDALRSVFEKMVEPELTIVNVSNGLLGAVTIGYAIVVGWIALEPFRRGERWAWNAIATSISAWAVCEFYVKWVSGLGAWSMMHFGLVIAFGIPLLATYSQFHPSSKSAEYSSLEVK